MSDYNGNDAFLRDAFASTRNAERISNTNRSVDDVKSELVKMKMLINAMWEIIQEQGVSSEVLNRKLDEILEREKQKKTYARYPMKPCPKCGKTIQESSKTPMRGRCLFCGEEVVFYPFAKEGDIIPNDPVMEEGNDALNI